MERSDEQGVRNPAGRHNRTAWVGGDVSHVVDMWDTRKDIYAFIPIARPVTEQLDIKIAGRPEEGELLSVARPN